MSRSVQPGGGQSSTAIAPLPTPDELVWAKVPGWQWWPARLLPLAKGLRTTDKEQLVLFLVDRTVSRVPSTPPLFHVHYQRFLGATYGNKKLFQAVEEARALLLDGSEAKQPLLTYPLPTRDDMKKTGRQLLQFLRQTALEPSMPLNKLNDQAYKRVLHAVRNNRLIVVEKQDIVLPPEQPTVIPPATVAVSAAPAASPTAATTAMGNGQQSTAAAAAAGPERTKRQRKPQAWLQHYGSWAEASKGRSAGSNAPAAADASKLPGPAIGATAAGPAAGTKAGASAAAAQQQPSTSTSKAARSTRATSPPQQQQQQHPQKVGPHMAMLRKKLQQQQQSLLRARSGSAPKPPLVAPIAANGATSSKATAAMGEIAAGSAGRSRAGRPRKRTAAALAAAEQAAYSGSSSSGTSSDQLSRSSDGEDIGSEVSSGLSQEQQQWAQRRRGMGVGRPGPAQLVLADSGMEPASALRNQLDKHRKKRKVMLVNGCDKQGENEGSNAAGAARKYRVAASADSSGNERQLAGAKLSSKRPQQPEELSRQYCDQQSGSGSEALEGDVSQDADLSDDPYAQVAQQQHAASGRDRQPSRLHLSSSSAGGSGSCRAHTAAAAAVAAAFGGLGARQLRQHIRQECNSPQLLQSRQAPTAAQVCCTCHQPLLLARLCARSRSPTLAARMRSRQQQQGVKLMMPEAATEDKCLRRLGSFSDWQQQQQQQLHGGGSGGCSSSSMEQCLALLDNDLGYALDVESGDVHGTDGETGPPQPPGVHQHQQAGSEHQLQLQIDGEGEQTLVDVHAAPHEGLLSPTGEPLHQPQVVFACDSSEMQPLAIAELGTDSIQQPSALQTTAAAAAADAACGAAAGELSSPLLYRSLSPLLGATLVDFAAVGHMTAGVAELLPGLEEDLQHAAAMFGHASPLAKHWDVQAAVHERDDLLCYNKDQQEKSAQLEQQSGQQHAGESGVVTSPQSEKGDTQRQQQQHIDSPSSCSHHATIQHLPGQWVLLHEKGKGPQGVKEVKQAAAAAAAARHSHGTRRQSVAAAAAAAAFASSKTTAQECTCGSSACGKLRGSCTAAEQHVTLAPHKLNGCVAQPHACKHVDELKCSQQAVQELQQQLTQKEQLLQDKDVKIAELSSHTAAQAKQLQQQAAELVAVKGLLVRMHLGEASAASITAAVGQQTVRLSAAASASAPGSDSSKAAAAVSFPASTAVTSTIATDQPNTAAEAAMAGAAEQHSDATTLLKHQQSDLQLLVSALEAQLQDTRRKSAELAKQQEAQALQLAARLAAAEQGLSVARQQLESAALQHPRGLKGILAPQQGRVRKIAGAGSRRSSAQAAAAAAVAADGPLDQAAADAAAGAKQPGGKVGGNAVKEVVAAAAANSTAADANAATSPAAAPMVNKGRPRKLLSKQQQQQQQSQQQLQRTGNPITASDVFKRPPQVAVPLTLQAARTGSISSSNGSNASTVNMRDLAAAIASLTSAAAKAGPGAASISPTMAHTAASLQSAGSTSSIPAAKAVTSLQGAAVCATRMPTITTAAQVAAAMQAAQNGSTIYALQMPPGSSPNGAPLLVLKPPTTTLNSLLALNAAHQRMLLSLPAAAAAGAAAGAASAKAAATAAPDKAATTCVLNLAAGDHSRGVAGNSSGKAACGAGSSSAGSGEGDATVAAAVGAGLWLGDAPSNAAGAAGAAGGVGCGGVRGDTRRVLPRTLAAAAAAGLPVGAAAAPLEETAPTASASASAASAAFQASSANTAATRAEAVPVVAKAGKRAAAPAARPVAGHHAGVTAVPASVLAEAVAKAAAARPAAAAPTAQPGATSPAKGTTASGVAPVGATPAGAAGDSARQVPSSPPVAAQVGVATAAVTANNAAAKTAQMTPPVVQATATAAEEMLGAVTSSRTPAAQQCMDWGTSMPPGTTVAAAPEAVEALATAAGTAIEQTVSAPAAPEMARMPGAPAPMAAVVAAAGATHPIAASPPVHNAAAQAAVADSASAAVAAAHAPAGSTPPKSAAPGPLSAAALQAVAVLAAALSTGAGTASSKAAKDAE